MGLNPRTDAETARGTCSRMPGRWQLSRLDRLTRGAARELRATLAAAGVAHDVKVYEGARHSFFSTANRAYDVEAADDSWRRTLAFFSTHLKSDELGED